jgi:hypothetical protein
VLNVSLDPNTNWLLPVITEFTPIAVDFEYTFVALFCWLLFVLELYPTKVKNSPSVLYEPEENPIAVLFEPFVVPIKELNPIAVFDDEFILLYSELYPIATEFIPSSFLYNA